MNNITQKSIFIAISFVVSVNIGSILHSMSILHYIHSINIIIVFICGSVCYFVYKGGLCTSGGPSNVESDYGGIDVVDISEDNASMADDLSEVNRTRD